jgi:hypothetical protein
MDVRGCPHGALELSSVFLWCLCMQVWRSSCPSCCSHERAAEVRTHWLEARSRCEAHAKIAPLAVRPPPAREGCSRLRGAGVKVDGNKTAVIGAWFVCILLLVEVVVGATSPLLLGSVSLVWCAHHRYRPEAKITQKEGCTQPSGVVRTLEIRPFATIMLQPLAPPSPRQITAYQALPYDRALAFGDRGKRVLCLAEFKSNLKSGRGTSRDAQPLDDPPSPFAWQGGERAEA